MPPPKSPTRPPLPPGHNATHPYYGAHTPWGGFLGAFPVLIDATQACSNMAATCAAARA